MKSHRHFSPVCLVVALVCFGLGAGNAVAQQSDKVRVAVLNFENNSTWGCGAVNASTAAQLGQLLGAQLILTGSITQFSIERQSGKFGRLGGSYSRANPGSFSGRQPPDIAEFADSPPAPGVGLTCTGELVD